MGFPLFLLWYTTAREWPKPCAPVFSMFSYVTWWRGRCIGWFPLGCLWMAAALTMMIGACSDEVNTEHCMDKQEEKLEVADDFGMFALEDWTLLPW